MQQFLSGGVFLGALVATLYFLRFWKDSNDSFFLLFAAAFALLGLERLPLLLASVHSETYGRIYFIRLIAFMLIILAIIQKNRMAKSKGDT